jgi:hypothetical protein
MGISSIVGGVGAIAGGLINANTASNAADQQAATIKQGQEQLAKYYGLASNNLTPNITAGQGATNRLQQLLGIGVAPGSDQSNQIMSTLEQTPGYQFSLGQGLKATQNNLTAQGLGQSGQAVAGAANYAQGLASQTYGQVAGLLQGQSAQGQNAATALGQMGTGTASQSAQLYNTLGNDQAASTIAQGNAYSGMANALGGAYANYNIMNQLGNMYGQGSGGIQSLGGNSQLGSIVNQIAM